MGLNSPGFLGWGASSAGSGLSIRTAHVRAPGFSGAAIIAGLLDSSPNATAASAGRISEALASGAARDISQAIDQLNPTERNALQARWGRSLDELVSLSNERDARVFHHGLLQVGRRLEDNDQVDLAGVVYSGLVAGAPPLPNPLPRGERGPILPGAEIVAGAQRRLNAINGVGDWRERFAFSLQRIPNQATRWDVLLAMTGAGFTFRGFRLLTTASWAGSFESALALNAASASTAFLAETIAFTSLGKVAGALAGHPQDTSANGIFNEWAGGAAMLLGLKGMGALTGAGVRSIYGEGVAATATGRLTQILAPQAGMFMGILVGNRLAEAGGFHPERHGDTWLVDGITTLIEFNVAGRLQRAAGGPALTSLEARMDAYTRALSSGHPSHPSHPLTPVSLSFGSELITPEGIRFNDFGTTHDVSNISQASAKSPRGGGRRTRGSGPGSSKPPSGRREGTQLDFPPPPVDPLSERRERESAPTELFEPAPESSPFANATGDLERPESESISPIPPTVVNPGTISPTEAARMGGARTEIRVELPEPSPPPPFASDRSGILPPPAPREMEVSPMGITQGTLSPAELSGRESPVPRVRTSLKATYAPGARLGPEGRYVVIEMIGKGGFGEVYKVRDTELNRYAAIKILQDPMRADLLQLFLKERQMTARLDPQHAVIVYDTFRTESGQPTQVMQLFDGYNFNRLLRAYFRNEPLESTNGNFNLQELMSLPNRFQMVADMLEALHSAHECGVIHRDVKPENIQRRKNGQIQFLDFGIGTESDAISEEMRNSMPPPAPSQSASRSLRGGRSGSTIAGTRGYMAPERYGEVANPRSVDIFAMSVVAYEMITGSNPWAEFIPNPNYNESTRDIEPELILSREPDSNRTRLGQFAGILPEGVRKEPPRFDQIMVGERPPWLPEIEEVIRRGLRHDATSRFSTLAQMREAWLLAPARVEFNSLENSRSEMIRFNKTEIEPRWRESKDGLTLPPQGWEYLHGPVEELIQKGQSWERGVSELITSIAGIIGDERAPGTWIEGHNLIAELKSWQLRSGGDFLPPADRIDLIQDIRLHAPEISISLERPLALNFLGRDITSGRAVEGPILTRITPFTREIASSGRETMNYVEDASGAIVGDWNQLKGQLRLPVGYYAVHFSHPGYAPMDVPMRLTHDDARRGVPFSRSVDFVPKALVPEGFRVAQGGRAIVGQNIHKNRDLLTGPAYPEREINLETVLIQEDMTTVGGYRRFIEDMMHRRLTLEEIREVMPHTTFAAVATRGRRIKSAVMSAISRDEVPVLGPDEGYYMVVLARGIGKKRTYRLADVSTHHDPFQDLVDLRQPVQALSYNTVLKYTRWYESQLPGNPHLEVPPIEYLEAISRNYDFGWLFPWGNAFDPNCVTCRLAFSPEESKYLQPVGRHPSGRETRDRSIVGTRDGLGNAREFSSTEAEEGSVLLFGGSIRHTQGVPFYPTTRTMMAKDAIMDGYGAFRLMIRIPRAK